MASAATSLPSSKTSSSPTKQSSSPASSPTNKRHYQYQQLHCFDATARETAYDGEAPLRELCDANGLKKNDFVQRAPQQRHLDSFMGTTMTDLQWARYFPGLSSLCVMKESSLVTASGIESCPQLETLWVTECSLTTPLGIDKVKALVRYGSNRRSVLSALSIALIA